jgi:hypothetical protein
MTKEKLLRAIDLILADMKIAKPVPRGPLMVEGDAYAKAVAAGKNVIRVLGEPASQWGSVFNAPAERGYEPFHFSEMYGTMMAIRDAIDADMLLTVEQLVVAETFDDLLEQAEYLLSKTYFLPAGVLGRAVLEEHLRKWCQRAACFPSKPKPTMSDFYGELHKGRHFTTLVLKQIEAMAAVGNEAAHSKPTLKREDVERMLRDLRGFLVANPMP